MQKAPPTAMLCSQLLYLKKSLYTKGKSRGYFGTRRGQKISPHIYIENKPDFGTVFRERQKYFLSPAL
jgi:hypothetical protein